MPRGRTSASPAPRAKKALTPARAKKVEATAAPSPKESSSSARRQDGSISNKSGFPEEVLAKTTPAVEAPMSAAWDVPVLPPSFVTWWFIVSSIVVMWDAAYVLWRPRSMLGVDLAWLWKPYENYATVDHLYGVEFVKKSGRVWNKTQGVLNLVEVAFTALYLLLVNYNDAASNVLGIVISTATAYKTVMYFALEAFSGWQNTKHNDSQTFWLLYVLPSSVWIIVPLLCVFLLASRLLNRLA